MNEGEQNGERDRNGDSLENINGIHRVALSISDAIGKAEDIAG